MKNEKGFSLLEVIIAIGLLGIIGIAFLGALNVAFMSIFIADERATTESLATKEMEYVESATYVESPWSYELPDRPPDWDEARILPNSYDGYTVYVTAEPLHGFDDGIQKITVTINHHGKPIITSENYTLEGYKVDR